MWCAVYRSFGFVTSGVACGWECITGYERNEADDECEVSPVVVEACTYPVYAVADGSAVAGGCAILGFFCGWGRCAVRVRGRRREGCSWPGRRSVCGAVSVRRTTIAVLMRVCRARPPCGASEVAVSVQCTNSTSPCCPIPAGSSALNPGVDCTYRCDAGTVAAGDECVACSPAISCGRNCGERWSGLHVPLWDRIVPIRG